MTKADELEFHNINRKVNQKQNRKRVHAYICERRNASL